MTSIMKRKKKIVLKGNEKHPGVKSYCLQTRSDVAVILLGDGNGWHVSTHS